MNNQPVIDPTKNVLQLVEASVKRIDDLRELESGSINKLLQMNISHVRDMMASEANRINAIRTVDAEAIKTANDRIAALEKSMHQISGTGIGRKDAVAWIIAGITTIIAIVSFVIMLTH